MVGATAHTYKPFNILTCDCIFSANLSAVGVPTNPILLVGGRQGARTLPPLFRPC